MQAAYKYIEIILDVGTWCVRVLFNIIFISIGMTNNIDTFFK